MSSAVIALGDAGTSSHNLVCIGSECYALQLRLSPRRCPAGSFQRSAMAACVPRFAAVYPVLSAPCAQVLTQVKHFVLAVTEHPRLIVWSAADAQSDNTDRFSTHRRRGQQEPHKRQRVC